MKKTPKILPTYYKSKGTPIFRDTTALPFAQGGPTRPPKFNFTYNPYAYNPNELVGYKGYGDLTGTNLSVSTDDLLGRQNKVNALKMPMSVSINRMYDPNVKNDTIAYDYISKDITASGTPSEVLQAEAQKQLDSAYQPYLNKSPLGFNIKTGIAGSGINPNTKKRTKHELDFIGGYNPLSGINAGVNEKSSFAFGNDFYHPLKRKGDWRAVGNIQLFGMQFSQAPGYSETQDIVQQNLQNTAETGEFNPNMVDPGSYEGPGGGRKSQVTFGAGLDGAVKLPLGTLVGGAGVKYNRAAGEAERLAPSGYLGYSVSGAELSKLGKNIPKIPMPNLSPLTGMLNKDEGRTYSEIATETGTGWGTAEGGFDNNASTLEGEDIYVPSRMTPNAEPIELPNYQETPNNFAQGGRMSFEPSGYASIDSVHYADGGPIYTYDKRPGSYYQKTPQGWMISNAGTNNQYVLIDDPTGERTRILNQHATVYKPQPQIVPKIYADPLSRNSETVQNVAAKTMPQSKQQWQDYETVKKDNQARRSTVAKALEIQGMTPKQAADTVASYGSDWPTLEAAKAKDIQIMNNTAANIQAGINPYKMEEYIPREEQSIAGKALDIAFSPMTAAGYLVRGQEIPDYMGEKADNGTLGYWSNGQFIQGRNSLDTVTDMATPIGWAHSAYNILDKAANNKSGDFWTEENAWDALNVVPGIGLAAKGMKYSPLLPQAYKINPWAGKLATYNRVVGDDAIADLRSSGLVRAGDYGGVESNFGSFDGVRTTPYPSFGKGVPRQVYIDQTIQQGKTPFVISTDRSMKASNLGRHGKGSTMFPVDETGKYMPSFSADDVKVFDVKPHWLKGYKEVSKELPSLPGDTFAYRNITPGKLPTTNTGLTTADVDREAAKNIEWITSPEYAARRAASTGETLEQIQKSVDNIITAADQAKYNLNTSPKKMDFYGAEGMMSKKKWWSPAKIEIASDSSAPIETLRHEVKHLYSPAVLGNKKVYENYPSLTAKDNYLNLKQEQQVRHLNAREQILAENDLPIDAQLSEEQVREFVDKWGSKMNKRFKNPKDFSLYEDYDDLWNEHAGEIQKEMLKARYNTDDLSFVSKLPTSQKVKFLSEYKDRLARSVTNVLNKAWATVPAAGGAALLNNSDNPEENK